MTHDKKITTRSTSGTALRYCSTCKRDLALKFYVKGKRTCRACLEKTRERQRVNRSKAGHTQFQRLLNRYRCSSCKCVKSVKNFSYENVFRKTCYTCRQKRTARSQAVSDELSGWQSEKLSLISSLEVVMERSGVYANQYCVPNSSECGNYLLSSTRDGHV